MEIHFQSSFWILRCDVSLKVSFSPVMFFSSLKLCEELLSALCTDEEAEFPWQQSYLYRHGLILLVVDIVEARGTLQEWQKNYMLHDKNSNNDLQKWDLIQIKAKPVKFALKLCS